MKVRITVNNVIPTKHASRSIAPKVEVEDEVQAGETPMQASRRVGLIATAIFAREVLDQLRFTDRQVQVGNEQWCDEFLTTVADDHPAARVDVTPELVPPEARAALTAVGTTIGQAAAKAWDESVKEKPRKG